MKRKIASFVISLCLFITPTLSNALEYEEVVDRLKKGEQVFDFADYEEYIDFVEQGWSKKLASSWTGYYAYQSFKMQDYEYSTKKPRLTFTPRRNVDITKEQALATQKAKELIREFNLKATYNDIHFAFQTYHKRYPAYRYSYFLPSDFFTNGSNCTGKTWVFEAILDELKVPNEIGFVKYKGQSHIYNIFTVNGTTYGADLTWNEFGFGKWGEF